MGLTTTEFNVIKVFTDFREASSAIIARQIMISSGYAEYLCRYLTKEGYLKRTQDGTYSLTLKGREALNGRTYRLLLDKNIIQAIAQELAKHLGTIPPTLPQIKKEPIKLAKTKVLAKKEIKIKESFINPLENEVELKHKFSQKPRESRSSSFDLEKTLAALKKVSK